jgi:hypothetical protein
MCQFSLSHKLLDFFQIKNGFFSTHLYCHYIKQLQQHIKFQGYCTTFQMCMHATSHTNERCHCSYLSLFLTTMASCNWYVESVLSPWHHLDYMQSHKKKCSVFKSDDWMGQTTLSIFLHNHPPKIPLDLWKCGGAPPRCSLTQPHAAKGTSSKHSCNSFSIKFP